MTEQTNQEKQPSAFNLRKINVSHNNEIIIDTDDNEFTDKIKILELSNLIDDWEQELLFSENGFFSLKGIEAKNKSKDFISELEKFINSKINEISFITEKAKNTAKNLKQTKIENIKEQILNHCEKELYDWEMDVYNNFLDSAVQKAVTYKNNPDIVQKQLNTALRIMNLIADNEQWSKKILTSKRQSFISDFYYSIISSFLEEKDIAFINWFNTFKDNLKDDKKSELEKITDKMKQSITAYNWAIELFSYNLDEKKNEIEIRKIKDEKLEAEVRKYINLLKNAKKLTEKSEKDKKIAHCWENILSFLEKEPAKALLYIDEEQNEDIKKAQKEYIKKFTEKGFIETDKQKYIELFEELLKSPDTFKNKSLFEFKHLLSDKDFSFFEQLQKDFDKEYFKKFPDYKLLFDKFTEKKIKSNEEKYSIILSYQNALEEYETINSKPADTEKRNKILSALIEIINKK